MSLQHNRHPMRWLHRALAALVLLAVTQGPVGAQSLPLIQEAKLVAGDGVANDQFGNGVAINGDTALIGAPLDDDNGSDSGAVYVLVRSGTTWTEQQKLVAGDGAANDRFGFEVALDGDTALIGAHGDDNSAGAAYVFGRSGTTWTQQAKLTASDRAGNDNFGFAVALDGDTALVSAVRDDNVRGAAYVFVRDGSTWTEQQKLVADDRAANDYFANAVALSGDTALLGSSRDDDVGNASGSAYVFVRSGTTWTLQQKLTASDGAAGDVLGARGAVALDGDTLVLGSAADNDNGSDSGSAYVFVRSGTTWTEQQKLLASDGGAGDFFGRGLGLDGDTLVIGARADDDNGSDSGAAYVFVRSGTTWSEQQKLTADDGAAGDVFGDASVALDGDTVLIGARLDDDLGSNSGSAYVFAPEPLVCVSIDDDHEGIDYRRGWHRKNHASASDGGYHRRMGNAIGTTPTARLTFSGTQITYHYAVSEIGGEADVYLDDIYQETIVQGLGGNGPDLPVFGSSVTYSDLGSGPHTLRIEHGGGAVYVDGFEICGPEGEVEALARFAAPNKSASAVGVDVSAVEYRSETETFTASALEGPIVVRTFTVDADDVEVSVNVEGNSAEPTVTLLDPIGLLLGTGESLLGGTAAGLDEAVSSSGLYSVTIVRPLLSTGALAISVARTHEVQ